MSAKHLIAALCLAAFAAASDQAADLASALQTGDECSDAATCAIHALQVRGKVEALQGAPDDGDNDPKYASEVTTPLSDLLKKIKSEVATFLKEAVKLKKQKATKVTSADVIRLSAELRKLAVDAVPIVVKARDASSAIDIDPRPRNTSQAKVAQDQLVMMQTYWGWAYPIIFDQVKAAYGDGQPGVSPKVLNGIEGSMKFLKPVLQKAWDAEKDVLPVVQRLVESTGTDTPEMMVKAKCAADYASGLGDITQVYAKLANSDMSCKEGSSDKDKAQQCAQDLLAGLGSVADTISQASMAMWECFGISWQCAEIFNSALEGLVRAMSKSLDITSGCQKGEETCERFEVFTALGYLVNAAGALESITQPGTCYLKGGTYEPHFMNPYAATPADLKKTALSQLSAAEAEELPTLALPQVTGEGITKELDEKLKNIAKDIEGTLLVVLDRTVSAMETKDFTGLVNTLDDVTEVLGKNIPTFFEAVQDTGALKADTHLKGLFGGLPEVAQQDIITMFQFTITNAPNAVYQIGGAESGMSKDNKFMEVVSAKLEKAQSFLTGALNTAWDGLKLQVPRIEAMSVVKEGAEQEKMAQWADCAADYASSLGALTSMYSNLKQSQGDCNVTDPNFLAVGCETDLLSSFTSIQKCVVSASKMMGSCFKSPWGCMVVTGKASEVLLEAFTQVISMTELCKETDPVSLDACESTAYSLLGSLGQAADSIESISKQCTGN